jgi:hypothetical protein
MRGRGVAVILGAMLAYVFWHAPAPGAGREDYERALLAFHSRLTLLGAPGLRAASTARIGGVPWLPDGGYEDTYLVEDFAALGALNAAAVDPQRFGAHDRVASASSSGAGALYALHAGDPVPPAGDCVYFAKPPGVSYQQLGERLASQTSGAGVSLWRRQLVLGPAPEFRLHSREPITLVGMSDVVVCRLTPLG